MRGIVAYLVLTFGYVGAILGVLAGRPWLVCSLETTLARVVPAVALAFVLLSHVAAWDSSCRDSGGGGGDDGAALKLVPAPAGVAESMSTPAILFGALLVQGVMQVSASIGRTLIVAPALTVQLITLIFYAAEYMQPSCNVVSGWPRAQSHLVPLHYALWVVSVSCQAVTLFSLERTQARGSPGARAVAADCTAGPSHRRCCVALLCTQGMIWASALGDAHHGDRAVAIGWMVAAFLCFYVVIGTGLWRPLAACRDAAQRSDDATVKHRSSRYVAVGAYLALVWHGFPLVWLANVAGLMTDHQCRMGYVVFDVLAKFLPPSLYLAVATAI